MHDSLPLVDVLRNDLKALANIFDETDISKAYCFSDKLNGATIEDFDILAKHDASKIGLLTPALITLFKHDVVIVQNNIFDRLTNDLHLPVIARNYLENGESKNLWYEQVVPRLSRFWSLAIHPEPDNLFADTLFKHGKVQIGANGSVGYGYCSFTKI